MPATRRRCRPRSTLALALACVAAPLVAAAALAGPVPYDIVYVRQPRHGDFENSLWPEVTRPGRAEPGADLVLLRADGSEAVLVAGGQGAVTDPCVSFDGEWVYYSYFHDLRPQSLNSQRDNLSYDGADIFKINVRTREKRQLTFGEFTPNTGAGVWDESDPLDPPPGYNYLGYGILNLGACPIAGGKVVFTSNRNAFWPPNAFGGPTLQLFVMDEDGSNVAPIAPMTIGSALHPTPLADGRIMFSTLESQGNRDSRLWGIWAIYPDGRRWESLIGAFQYPQAFHFMTQLGGGDIVVADYYNQNNNGFGGLFRFPVSVPPGTPRFYGADPDDNPPLDATNGGGGYWPVYMSFTPWGAYSISPFTHPYDEAAPQGPGGKRVGKFTQPSAAPGGDLLAVWSPGPANDLDRPTPIPYYDGGLYLARGGDPVASPQDLVLIKNSPAYNEAWPRALVPYRAIHGIIEPKKLPWLPNDGTGHAALPAGTPYGLIGSSSLYKRESFPGFVIDWTDTFDGLDAFNTLENDQSSNWLWQGSDAGKYDNGQIAAVRLVALEPNTHRSYGPAEGMQFYSHARERMRILGEVPVRKLEADGDPVLDPEGNPDTSFLVKVPADTPLTFQTLDRNGLVLNMAQTWHQVRPGEARANCGGCHAHSQLPLPIEQTAAARPGYRVRDLSRTTPLLSADAGGKPRLLVVPKSVVNVEFYRDIRPILQRSCVGCHTKSDPTPPGNLVLDDLALYDRPGLNLRLPGDYARLAADEDARWGHPPVIGGSGWRQTNASRYVRRLQSRRSLLIWKIFGRRLDGWTNADHPTEAVPGDRDTLPPGAEPNDADLDYKGTIMPPPNGGVPPLSEDEKRLFARWVDLGCPIDAGDREHGWFLDDLRPTVHVDLPRAGANPQPLTVLRIGLADAYSGIAADTLSIRATVAINGRPAGSELADMAVAVGGDVYELGLDQPLDGITKAQLQVAVKDRQGNVTRVRRRFSVGAG